MSSADMVGVTKSYQRYEPLAAFGVISSPASNVCLNSTGNLAVCGALQQTIIWNVRKGQQERVLFGDKGIITRLVMSPDGDQLAVGDSEGSIKLWSINSGTSPALFTGHTVEISSLAYNNDGDLLASGSKDTDVVVWDVVGECGKYRLRGHKGIITGLAFLPGHNVLLSASADGTVKVWDLDTQHCVQTLSASRAEVWSMQLIRDGTMLMIGSTGKTVKLWKLIRKGTNSITDEDVSKKEKGDDDHDDDDYFAPIQGSITRCTDVRAAAIRTIGNLVGIAGPDNCVEFFRLRSGADAKKKAARRVKRLREKFGKRDEAAIRDADEKTDQAALAEAAVPLAEDELEKLHILRTTSKVCTFDLAFSNAGKSSSVQLLLGMRNNSLQVHNITIDDTVVSSERTGQVEAPGHRSDVRCVSFSGDSAMILTGGIDGIKVWNRATQSCVRSISAGYVVCCSFTHGDRYAVAGTKSGSLLLLDLSAGTVLEEREDAHKGFLYSLDMRPDHRGFVTGGADKTVKFWDFELVDDPAHSSNGRRFGLVHARTLQFSEEVLCVRHTPDQRLLCVSLLDCTVKVFFSDSLKFFLSLYGHKLPVFSMSVSSDSALLVTGSSDKSVKIWGLDFGDCHKSLYAHHLPVSGVSFVPGTHYFFSVGKDNLVKYWDGDTFNMITVLEGHSGEVWGIATSATGDYVASVSHDRSIRLWERTDDLVFLEEERERERELAGEADVIAAAHTKSTGDSEAAEAGVATLKTMATIQSGELLIEAIELAEAEIVRLVAAPPAGETKHTPNPMLVHGGGDGSPSGHVLAALLKIRSADIEEALVVLPFAFVMKFLLFLVDFLRREVQVELSCRCLFFLLRIHQDQIVSNHAMLPVLDALRGSVHQAVGNRRDIFGTNLAALKFVKRRIEEESNISFFGDAESKLSEIRKAGGKPRPLKKRRVIKTVKSS